MRISVIVKPNSRVDAVQKCHDEYVVRVKARAVDGKANEAVIKLVAEYFTVPKTRVRIVRGATSKHKAIEVRE